MSSHQMRSRFVTKKVNPWMLAKNPGWGRRERIESRREGEREEGWCNLWVLGCEALEHMLPLGSGNPSGGKPPYLL